jgi:2-amino-4-hydroxy-6-hydroxymethyldihydropteridine diphosphokinase
VKQNAYLITGSNLGNREQNLKDALTAIEKKCGHLIATSALFETAAWGKTDQPSFLNQAIHLQTELHAENLLNELLSIEKDLGRIRSEKYGPRTIDIDIAMIDQLIIKSENLTIPHPELHNRRFVLTPLVSIAANLVHPVLNKSMAELLKICTDTLPVTRFD